MSRELQIVLCGWSVWLVGKGLEAVEGGWSFPAAAEEPREVLRSRMVGPFRKGPRD